MNKIKNAFSVITVVVLFLVSSGFALATTAHNSAPVNTHDYLLSNTRNHSSNLRRVRIQHMQFTPMNVRVRQGTRVTWTNYDNIPHTTTSNNTTGNQVWNSGRLSRGQSFTVTFSHLGTFAYHCTIHPQMRGTVTVVR